MRTIITSLLTIVLALSLSGWAPAQGLDWNKTFGGADFEEGHCVQQTADGGYIIVGTTYSYGAGWADVWLIKTDANGNKQWDKTFGSANDEYGRGVQQTTDGGYIILGQSYGTHGQAIWLIKTDANGNLQWSKPFAGTEALGLEQTTDGGYIITGIMGGPFTDVDLILIKADANGSQEWYKQIGEETSWELGMSVRQTIDSGYIIAGIYSTEGPGPAEDVLLMKTDANGNQVWVNTFGGPYYDEGHSVDLTADGGYIIAGFTDTDGDYAFAASLIKTDANGNEEWSRTFGEQNGGLAESVQQTIDGGYILTGYLSTNGVDIDIWLLKTDANGNQEWSKTFGGIGTDWGSSVQQTTDGGYIVAGRTSSYGTGDDDVWLIKAFPPELTAISLSSPADSSLLSSPPTFEWIPNGGTDNTFAVDVSSSSTFRKYWSSFENLHQTISGTTWTMPPSAWSKLPAGRRVFWRVRGRDSAHTPPTVIYSSEVRSFTKQ